jgi:hypothetical protein
MEEDGNDVAGFWDGNGRTAMRLPDPVATILAISKQGIGEQCYSQRTQDRAKQGPSTLLLVLPAVPRSAHPARRLLLGRLPPLLLAISLDSPVLRRRGLLESPRCSRRGRFFTLTIIFANAIEALGSAGQIWGELRSLVENWAIDWIFVLCWS